MDFCELLSKAPNAETQLILAKGKAHIGRCFGNIACAVSGGSDSDIMLDILTKLDDEKKIQYVFFDTGIEYQATKNHLDDLEKKYGIEIKRICGEVETSNDERRRLNGKSTKRLYSGRALDAASKLLFEGARL